MLPIFRKTIFGLLLCLSVSTFAQRTFMLTSPDRRVMVRVRVAEAIQYEVLVDSTPVIQPSTIDLSTNLSLPRKPIRAKTHSHQGVLHPLVWQKTSVIADAYNELQLALGPQLRLDWRAYNNGVAWRWVISDTKGDYLVLDEQATITLGTQGNAWYPAESSFLSHNECRYKQLSLDSLDTESLASLPALFAVKGIKLLLTEADLFNYPGMWLRGGGSGTVKAVFPPYPKTLLQVRDRTEKVTSTEPYLAKLNKPQSLPWRVVMVARTDNELLINQLPYQLGRPATGDFSWVKPGKVAWDWWNANNLTGVAFRAGINNDTYERYIDFAARYKLEYVLLDEGWSAADNLAKLAKNIDVAELVAYGRARGVDILLWVNWLPLNKTLEASLDQFVRWGVKGIKVDFMQRDDQLMVNFYERVANACATRHLLVDFHGAYKPTGWLRSWPHALTSEGVFGNENNKFNDAPDPQHTVTLPFIRMAAGPMDFTPGGMRNAQKKDWASVHDAPMTQGTRCHELSMYVLYESPLQMLCDAPTQYEREPDCMRFLASVPTEWQQTVPLRNQVGQYASLARQARNGDWYVGAMTNWTPRDLTLALTFLGAGYYQMDVWMDGVNADRNATDFRTETLTVTRNTMVPVKLVGGGGWVARITKKQ